MIRKALLHDLTSIHQLTQSCAKAMIANGIYQWNENYPTKERFEKDIALQELYVLEEENHIKGIIVLTELMDEEYIPIQWLTKNNNNLYIHRLAIDPEYWGKGYAQQLMDFAEQYAKDNAYQSIRLDTFGENKRNLTFYETRGYQRLGDIYFPKQSEHPFHCYELII
ncbi:GNAT family N-acetyltransferase [Aquimarina longa]|uniref:GNAT family N-acetyltransferase n=1 Tax=Aquimarina longa TaxID=1080221 RepID=UPI000782A14A|nr:GNAT family N-acetyltransferase [Aquimarina longa]